ncbi:MAG TPA: SPOR domain-containing protein [Spirochaetota bacterium]|nr:SPOR domain-containing protein [Spirochaetota bacterium]
MENFDPKPNAVKEKNLYIVHLDTPRIIILSSVIIGIITAAFLFGMSFMKDDKPGSKELTVSGMNFDDNKTADMLRADIPPIPGGGLEEGAGEDKIAAIDENKDNTAIKDDIKLPQGNEIASAKEEIKHDKGDVLTNENIREIIPPAGDKNKSSKKTEKIAKHEKKNEKQPSKKIAAHDKKKSDDKREISNGKSRIYEVSRDVNEKKSYDSYAVQVASYDTLSKAENEKSLLKSKRFDAYIDKSAVNGKNYFRVRIGPVSSSKKAYELLNEVQSDSRYAGSYMVKD